MKKCLSASSYYEFDTVTSLVIIMYKKNINNINKVEPNKMRSQICAILLYFIVIGTSICAYFQVRRESLIVLSHKQNNFN